MNPADIHMVKPDDLCDRCGEKLAASEHKHCTVCALVLRVELLEDLLQEAVARIELANHEGDKILSAWLPGAREALTEKGDK